MKVGDLGLAKSMGSDTTGLTQTGTAMGTPNYISPEQAKGEKDLDFRADIYSLGCTLFQMLTGRTPYEGRDPVADHASTHPWAARGNSESDAAVPDSIGQARWEDVEEDQEGAAGKLRGTHR